MGTVIYDGDCAFCTAAVKFAQSKITNQHSYQPYQKANLPELGLTKSACESALHFVGSNKKIYLAQDAIAQLLIGAKNVWSAIGYLIKLPIINQLAGLGYRIIAKHRSKLPGGSSTCEIEQT